MRFTFTFNNISNTEMGAIVSVRPPIKSPQARMQFYNVDGTYGSTSKFLGYEPVQNQMELIVESEDYLDSIKEWLTGTGEFTRSDRPNLFTYIHIIDVLEFEQLPNSSVYIGTLNYTNYNPVWGIRGETKELTPLANHGSSWTYAYTVENKGTEPSLPILLLDNVPQGQIKIADGNVTINKNHALLSCDTLTGQVYRDNVRDDNAVSFTKGIELKPGITKIYSDINLNNMRILNPSTYI